MVSTKQHSANWLGPVFISTYLLLGVLCIGSPIECKEKTNVIVDKDAILYENARILQASGGKSAIDAVNIYMDLVKKGYYEILDILIEIFYYGIPGYLEPSDEKTEKLFSMRVKTENMLKQVGLTYVPRFPDAVAKNGSIVKKLRFVEVQEKAKVNIVNDVQNTHDPGVTGSVKAAIEKLRSVTNITADAEEAIIEIRQWITLGKLDKKKQSTAMRVLDKIATNTEMLSSVNMSERDIIALIFNRINDPSNEQVRATLMENLTEELADCQDQQGYLYCFQGRVSRLLNALNVLDTEVIIKPKWAIRQEMLGEASQLKQRVTDALPNKLKEKIDQGGAFSDKYDERFRDLLRQRFKVVYVDTKIMSQKDLDDELKDWIEHV